MNERHLLLSSFDSSFCAIPFHRTWFTVFSIQSQDTPAQCSVIHAGAFYSERMSPGEWASMERNLYSVPIYVISISSDVMRDDCPLVWFPGERTLALCVYDEPGIVITNWGDADAEFAFFTRTHAFQLYNDHYCRQVDTVNADGVWFGIVYAYAALL